jgi:DNA replication protein DnaC
MIEASEIQLLAKELRIHSVSTNWKAIQQTVGWDELMLTFLRWEKSEREKRRLDRLVKMNGLLSIEPMANFDWNWPQKIDREKIQDLFTLEFIEEKANIVLIGSTGLGKTMIAQNLVDHASRKGHTSLFIESSALMGDLVPETSRRGLEAALTRYTRPKLLAIDELGYLSYDARFADLLFQLIQRRAKCSSTIVTTNRSFREWPEVFPNAASVTALIDRIIERCEVIHIEGASYRGKRFEERTEQRKRQRTRAAQQSSNTKLARKQTPETSPEADLP